MTERIYKRLSDDYFRTPGGHIRIVNPKEMAACMEENQLRIYAVTFAHAFHTPYWMLRCLVGLHNEKARIPAAYRKFLHWSLFSQSLRIIEKALNYFFPKSIVLYAQKV